MEMTIVYDNNSYDQRLSTAWGFGCVIAFGGLTILFDTGGDGAILLSNMRELGIAPESIDLIVLSHIHGDHVGGLQAFLHENHDVTVHVPASFPESFTREIRRSGARLERISGPQELAPGVYTTGDLEGPVREQSLILNTEAGLVVATGCAHPGVTRIVEEAKRVVPNDVALVVGGFHLGGHSESQINAIVNRFQELGVRFAAPCHCSGDLAREKFRQAYGSRYLPAGVGYRISSETLLLQQGPLLTRPGATEGPA
jgi:7,8-dihydropterin-6-yl-methyl-4-(beta-D-ribofuranosyl)aminobenzene 5'-phosphate synthase